MAALDELLLALDDYMNNSGVKGTKGKKFLATKLASVFNHKDSPFNMTPNGILHKLGERLDMLTAKIANINNAGIIDKVFDEFQHLHVHMGHMNTGFSAIANETSTMSKEMNSFSSKLKKFDLSKILNINISGSSPLSHNAPGFPIQGFMTAFEKMFQHYFSSTFTKHDTNKLNKKGEYIQRQIRAIDVHLVKIKPGTFDDFFVQYQRRFSTTAKERVLEEPGPKGEKKRMVHALDVNLVEISPDILKSLKSSIESIKKEPDEGGGWFSKIMGTITKGLMFFGGLAGISYFLEKTAIGKIVLDKVKGLISYISDKFSELLKSGMIENAIKGLSASIGAVFSYLMAGTGNFLKDNKDVIFSIMQTGIFATFQGVSEFMQSTFSFYGLKEKMGKGGEGTATLATKGIFVGISKLTATILNKISGGIFGKVGGFITRLFEKIPNLIGGILEGKGLSMIEGVVAKNAGKLFGGKGFLKALGGIALKFGGKFLKVMKFIPFIGTLISWHSAYERGKSGDYVGMTLDIASGIATIFPGIGTAISIGLDVFNAFLDYKSSQTGLAKGQMIGNFLEPLTKWAKETFTYEKLRNLPMFGGIIRMGEGAAMIWKGDTKNGLKTLFASIAWMTPIPGLPEILGIMDYFGDDKSASKQLPSAISSSLNINKFVDSIVSFVSDTVEGFIGLLKRIFAGVTEWYSKSNIGSSFVKGFLNVNKEVYDKTKSLFVSPKESNVNKKKVDDAVIVQPHNKDQILMAKSGGVFDLAMKEMVKKMDEEIQLLREGFHMLANATMTGSGQVANAVISTANTSSGPNAIGGSNRIHDLRDYHSSKIRS